MSEQTDGAAKLNAIADQLEKVRTEVQALKDAAANENLSPEMKAAIDRVGAAVQVVDDVNPDAPANG